MPARRKRTHINAATADGGARDKAYRAAAAAMGITLGQWILRAADAALDPRVADKLPELHTEVGRRPNP